MNKTNPNWKTTLANTIENIPNQELTKLIKNILKQSTEIPNQINPYITKFANIHTSNYFLESYNENIKIAKTLIYRIKEMAKLIKKLQNQKNNIFCSLHDFDESISILEKRVHKNSKLSFKDSAVRKLNIQWYFDQLQLDIQTLGTLLNMLNIDFNIFNNVDFLTSQNALKPCTTTPNIQTDTSYSDDIKNTYNYCKDGVCNTLSSYIMPKRTQKLKRGKKKTRKNRSKK